MTDHATPLVVCIATPLEEELVDCIRRVDPDRIEVLCDQDLLPPKRYSIDHHGRADFTRTAEQEDRWRSYLGRAEVLWDFPPDLPDGTSGLALAPNVRWIQTTSSGIGQRVVRFGLHRTDIILTNAAGVHAGPLTEFVFLTLLAHSRRLRHLDREQRAHRWERFTGHEWEGKTLAVIGTGGVGTRVIEVAGALGMRVVALARPGSTHTAESLGIDALFPAPQLHAMLRETDALVLSVPHTSHTEGLIDREALEALKPGAVLVNVARGRVIDQQALVDHLTTGRIAMAGLDVFDTEPLPADHPLWDLANVIISPHSSANADTENEKIVDLFCHNLRCYMDGRINEMINVFDKKLLY